MATPLKTLIAKLNATSRQAAERAASLCMARGNYEVDLEHLFLALLENRRSDFAVAARASGIDPAALQRDLEAEVGASRPATRARRRSRRICPSCSSMRG